MFIRHNKGQSILEYAILLGVVIAAILIMQVFVKRGYQGGLKESADKMGEQFSAGGTTILQNRSMSGDQTIKEEVATGTAIGNFTSANLTGTLDKGVYSYSERSGGTQTMETKTATDAAKLEKARWNEFSNETVTDFTPPF